ncbi:MAG: hypothetical protein GF417_09705 [Candidatus Latescibacteria bacterium]|nr:hypothetical protein [bacterium]MBD3424700.1 hypothetical protein [Candidatus Latescibacterota bacterium]
MGDFDLNSVNWQDGMLLSMKHLRDQDSSVRELCRWHAASAGDGYGLVKKPGGQPPVRVSATLSGSTLKIELSRCQALMPCGMYVEYNQQASGGEVLKAEGDVNETTVPVYLGVSEGEKIQTGDPDPSEEIPRAPYEMPKYILTLAEPPNLPASHYIKLELFNVSGSQVVPDPDYFPPSVTVSADERLASRAVDYRNRMENLLKLSTRAYMAASTSGGLEGASTKLQNAFRETMYFMVYHMASHLDDFRTGDNGGHPLDMIIQLKKLFRVVSSLLNSRPGLTDYLNEKFFSGRNSESRAYISSVDGFLMSEYNHRDIANQVKMADQIIDTLSDIMAFLAQTSPDQLLDQEEAAETMTYQGKTYKVSELGGNRLEEVGELAHLVMDPAQKGPISDAVVLINKSLFSEDEWRSMQVRLGLNRARGLGETDPVEIDVNAYRNKVVLHPLDMLQSPSVDQVTLIFRGVSDPAKLKDLGKKDLVLYVLS